MSFNKLDRALFDLLVDKIFVYDSGRLEIKLAFQNPLADMNEYMERVSEVRRNVGKSA